MTALLTPAEALDLTTRWAATADLGGSGSPMVAVDLRGLHRSFRADHRDENLAERLLGAPWVNVAVIDDRLDPDFVPLAEAFDVVLAEQSQADLVVATDDVDEALDVLSGSIESSPQAAVELVRLLRLTHQATVSQALHGESLAYGLLQTGETYQRWLGARRARGTPIDDADEGPAVATELRGSLLRITLTRPHKRNALNVAMRDQLFAALELAELDSSIEGVLLRGAGDNFSAGGDLDEFGTTPSPAVGHHVRMVRSLGLLIHHIGARVRVHVHGTCVGAGIELPAFASTIIAHPSATFRLPEVGFGLVPGAGGTVSVTRRCGRHRTAWLALTGATIDAEQARRWQLIDRIDADLELATA